MSSLADRIKEAMEGAGLRPADLARATKKTSGAVAMWLGGGIKSLKADSAAAIESATGYSADWIVTGKPPKRREGPFIQEAKYGEAMWEDADKFSTPEDPDPMRAKVPVVGAAMIGEEGLFDDIRFPVDRPDGYIDGYSSDPTAYALRIRGDGLHPALRDGHYIAVEPAARCEPGEYVVIVLDDGTTMVKEFMFERSGSVTVLSVNTGKRSTFDRASIKHMHAIVAEVSASRWHRA